MENHLLNNHFKKQIPPVTVRCYFAQTFQPKLAPCLHAGRDGYSYQPFLKTPGDIDQLKRSGKRFK